MNDDFSSRNLMEVNRLLRCRKTQLYYSESGWTPDLGRAKSFPNQLDAVRECLQRKLSDVDLVLRVPGGRGDLFSTAVF